MLLLVGYISLLLLVTGSQATTTDSATDNTTTDGAIDSTATNTATDKVAEFVDPVMRVNKVTDTSASIGALLKRDCPIGWGYCINLGACCPVYGQCCSTGGCCRNYQFCSAPGRCCWDGQFSCDTFGCCNPGESCCRGGACCGAGFYCVLRNDGSIGCCPDGNLCYG